MQFLTSLFGGSGNEILNTVLALGIVLALILFGLWAMKVLMRLSAGMTRRNRRLAVIDAVPVDARRRLVIVRRDNVEHLILVGGAQDLVIETAIPVERPTLPVRRPAEARPQEAARPPRPRAATKRAAPLAPAGEPTPAPPEPAQELGRPLGQRSAFSLRHTGLMRPVSRVDPAILPALAENPDKPAPDSAKTAHQDDALAGQADTAFPARKRDTPIG
jgi:flagellar biogenesis protein FliO